MCIVRAEDPILVSAAPPRAASFFKGGPSLPDLNRCVGSIISAEVAAFCFAAASVCTFITKSERWNEVFHLNRRWALKTSQAISAERSPGLESPSALGGRKLSGKQTNGEIHSQPLRAGKDKGAVAHTPRRDRTHDAVGMKLSACDNHVGKVAFDDDEAATIPRAFEFPLEAFTACADAGSQVAGRLAFDKHSVQVRAQAQVSSFQACAFKRPTLRQKGCPGVWPRLAAVAKKYHSAFPRTVRSAAHAATTSLRGRPLLTFCSVKGSETVSLDLRPRRPVLYSFATARTKPSPFCSLASLAKKILNRGDGHKANTSDAAGLVQKNGLEIATIEEMVGQRLGERVAARDLVRAQISQVSERTLGLEEC